MRTGTSRLAGSRAVHSGVPTRARKWTLVVHVVASVGLLGDTAVILVLGVVAATTTDSYREHASYEFMRLLIPMFGIPLILIALSTGLLLARARGPDGLRQFWVRAKLSM